MEGKKLKINGQWEGRVGDGPLTLRKNFRDQGTRLQGAFQGVPKHDKYRQTKLSAFN